MFQPQRIQRASRPIELYGFEDEDFSKYPCIKIPETNYTIDEYEAIANTLHGMLASDDSQVFSKAARGIAVLAYNTLMNPCDWNKTDPRPLFHKQNETEPWLRYRDEPAIDLGEFRQSNFARQGDRHSFRLVEPDASEFQRKSSIGIWALLHLKAFGHISPYVLRKSFIELHDQQKLECFLSTYKIPALSERAYISLKNEYKNRRNTEILYLFFRAAIVLEQNDCGPGQRCLLKRIAFGGYNGFRYGGLWLWHDFRNAFNKKKGLMTMPMVQLCDHIDQALTDLNCTVDSDRLKAVLEISSDFYIEYERRPLPVENRTQKSRYYMYAHVVDNDYFYWLGSQDFPELSYALHIISEKPNLRPPSTPYKEWGEKIAARYNARILEDLPKLLQAIPRETMRREFGC